MKQIVGIVVFCFLLSCTEKNGSDNGVYREYYDSGELFKTYHLDEDSLVSGEVIIYYKNGQIKSQIPWKEGSRNGKAYFYYENGALANVAHFINNEKNGNYEIYDTLGSLVETGITQNGMSIGDILQYSKKGDIIRKYYAVNAMGNHYSQGYLDYDSLGNIVNETRYLWRVAENDTINLQSEYKLSLYMNNPRDIDSIQLYYGEYSYDFQVKDSSSLNLIRISNDTLILTIKANDVGVQKLRGCFTGFKRVYDKNGEMIDVKETAPFFFEQKYFVTPKN